MRAVVVGAGAVGSRAARQLASSPGVDSVVVCDRRHERAVGVATSLGPVAEAAEWTEDLLGRGNGGVRAMAVVVATPGALGVARSAVERGLAVVSTVDDADEVEELLSLAPAARGAGATVVAGAAMAPGLTCVLARLAAARLDRVEEVHVSKAGTGGPACARQHHRALRGEAIDWRDGTWQRRRAGSGRELAWFPDPVRGLDCYRAELPDAALLVRAFPRATRVTARVAASRRDRLSAPLPMLRKPHPEGEIGAVRVEVRGRRNDQREVEILGAIDRPAVAAGAVAAVAATWAVAGELSGPGAGGLAEMVDDPARFLAELNRRGVKAAVFEGARA